MIRLPVDKEASDLCILALDHCNEFRVIGNTVLINKFKPLAKLTNGCTAIAALFKGLELKTNRNSQN